VDNCPQHTTFMFTAYATSSTPTTRNQTIHCNPKAPLTPPAPAPAYTSTNTVVRAEQSSAARQEANITPGKKKEKKNLQESIYLCFKDRRHRRHRAGARRLRTPTPAGSGPSGPCRSQPPEAPGRGTPRTRWSCCRRPSG
jgi:hypothetical protein